MGWYRRSTVLASARDAAVVAFDADLSSLMVGMAAPLVRAGNPKLIRDPGLMRRNVLAGRSIRLRCFFPLATLGAAHPLA